MCKMYWLYVAPVALHMVDEIYIQYIYIYIYIFFFKQGPWLFQSLTGCVAYLGMDCLVKLSQDKADLQKGAASVGQWKNIIGQTANPQLPAKLFLISPAKRPFT